MALCFFCLYSKKVHFIHTDAAFVTNCGYRAKQFLIFIAKIQATLQKERIN